MLTKTRTTFIAGLAAAAALMTTGVASAAIAQRTTTSPVVAAHTNVTTVAKDGSGKGSGKQLGLTCEQAIIASNVYGSLATVQGALGDPVGSAINSCKAEGVLQAGCGVV
jgi:hypothetical protein